MKNRPPVYRGSPPPLPRPGGAAGPMQPRTPPQRPGPILFVGLAVIVLLLLIFAWLAFTVVEQQIAKNKGGQTEANNSTGQQDSSGDDKKDGQGQDGQGQDGQGQDGQGQDGQGQDGKGDDGKGDDGEGDGGEGDGGEGTGGEGTGGEGTGGEGTDGEGTDGKDTDGKGDGGKGDGGQGDGGKGGGSGDGQSGGSGGGRRRNMNNRPGSQSGISFFQHVVTAKTVAYVIDCSASMDKKLLSGQTRLERAKQELLNSVNRLDQSQTFTVVFYDTKAYFERELIEIGPTPANLETLSKWVAENYAAGGKDPLPALHTVLQGDYDSVFLLSDGEFDEGSAREVRRLNVANIPIYTIALGANSASLKTIAAGSGGKHEMTLE